MLKKLMFFITSLKIGGSEKACVRTANALVPFFDVTVCTLFGGGELQKELRPEIKVRNVFPRFVRGTARISSALPSRLCAKMYVRGDYDIIIAVGDGLESHIVSGSNAEKLFSWVHMDVRFHGDAPSEKTQKRYDAFDKIICVSETAKEGFISKYGFADKIKVAYTPVDVDGVIAKSCENSAVKIPFDGEYYISVGRLETVKGLDRLIAAVCSVESVRLVLVGNGSQREALTELAEKLGAENRVFFAGMLVNPYPSVKNAKAFVCASLNESFGFAPLEAMALGVPVISAKCGGVEEIMNGENSGILCENSVGGLTDALRGFENGVYSVDTDKARKRAYDFSAEKCLDTFIEIISN